MTIGDTVISATDWVDHKSGKVDRRIFSDEEIYRQELERIFARGWNFICHESQLPDSGSFFLTYIGEDQVIAAIVTSVCTNNARWPLPAPAVSSSAGPH